MQAWQQVAQQGTRNGAGKKDYTIVESREATPDPATSAPYFVSTIRSEASKPGASRR